MKQVAQTFGRGLLIVLPLLLTAYLVFWLARALDGMIAPVLEWLPGVPSFPGLGLILALGLIYLVGFVMKADLVRKLWRWIESHFEKIPAIGSLYSSLRDLAGLFQRNPQEDVDRVVMVDTGQPLGKVMGFVTRERFDDLPKGIGDGKSVAVYLPMSYQLGGYTAIINRDQITPVDMPMDQAMRFALTAGVKTQDTR